MTSAPVIIVSMSLPGYPSAGLLPSRARFRFTRQRHCTSTSQAVQATAQLTLLSRRGVRDDQRRASLPLAGGRSGWRRTRHFGAEMARHTDCKALFHEAAKGPTLSAACDRYRQARQLRGRSSRGVAERAACAGSVAEQPSRGLAPADPSARAADETLQVDATRTEIPFEPRSDQQLVPALSAWSESGELSRPARQSVGRVARGDVWPETRREDTRCNPRSF